MGDTVPPLQDANTDDSAVKMQYLAYDEPTEDGYPLGSRNNSDRFSAATTDEATFPAPLRCAWSDSVAVGCGGVETTGHACAAVDAVVFATASVHVLPPC